MPARVTYSAWFSQKFLALALQTHNPGKFLSQAQTGMSGQRPVSINPPLSHLKQAQILEILSKAPVFDGMHSSFAAVSNKSNF